MALFLFTQIYGLNLLKHTTKFRNAINIRVHQKNKPYKVFQNDFVRLFSFIPTQLLQVAYS